MIPEPIRTLFWDVDLESFDPAQHAAYVIGRVLELGDRDAIRWLRETFSEQLITEVVRTDRRLSRRSANFWALVFGIPAGEVAALSPNTDTAPSVD